MSMAVATGQSVAADVRCESLVRHIAEVRMSPLDRELE